MKNKLVLLAGAAVGYVFGTRAGRERYEQIKDGAAKFWKNPQVQEKISDAEHAVTDAAKSAVDAAGSKVSEFRHRSGNGSNESNGLWSDDELADDDLGTVRPPTS